jgi:hypothetical protein
MMAHKEVLPPPYSIYLKIAYCLPRGTIGLLSYRTSLVLRDYCLAARSALTDDGHSPCVLMVSDYMTGCSTFATPSCLVEGKGGLPLSLHELHQILK